MLGPYRGVLLDLDGVLFRGDERIPGARETVSTLRAEGLRLAFVTNNSSRTPAQVAEKLERLGFDASVEEIVTSALALGELLDADGRGRARTAYVIGEDGVREALGSFGVEVLDGDPEEADVVVVGWDRTADYDRLKRAGLLVQRGARLLATNADGSYPAPDGLWPGAGALLAAIVTTTGAHAAVAGKPARPLFELAGRRLGDGPVLVVGDRLETDVAGARDMGWDAALVLTGVTRPADLVRSRWLPDRLLRSVADLLADPPAMTPATDADVPAVRALLVGADLFAGDVGDRVVNFVVARPADGSPVGAGALEIHGADALLRSVAVVPERRGTGVGTLLAARLVARAREESVARLYLLTETAEGFFRSLGFRAVDRAEVPPSIQQAPAVVGCSTADAVAMRFDVR